MTRAQLEEAHAAGRTVGYLVGVGRTVPVRITAIHPPSMSCPTRVDVVRTDMDVPFSKVVGARISELAVDR